LGKKVQGCIFVAMANRTPSWLHFSATERKGLALLALLLCMLGGGVALYGRFVQGPALAPVPLPMDGQLARNKNGQNAAPPNLAEDFLNVDANQPSTTMALR